MSIRLVFPALWRSLLIIMLVVSLVTVPVYAATEQATPALAARSSHPVQGEISGTPQTGAAGVAETTAQIMQREAAAAPQPPHSKPRFQVDRSHLSENPASPAVAQWPSVSAPNRPVSPLGPQTVGISFTGATLADTGAFPPDTMGTVGPTQFIVAVNGRLRSFDKTTGVADGVLNVDMDTFFASVMTPLTPPIVLNFTSDPRIRYDRLTGCWFVIIIDVPCTNNFCTTNSVNRVLIAMSNTSTITAGTTWTFFYFNPDASNFADYPTLGIDANALYIGANMFTLAGIFASTSGYVVRKSSLTSGGPIVWTPFANLAVVAGAGPFTPQGVDNYDPAATEGYFIGADITTFGILMIRRISNPGGTPTISGNLSLTVPTTTNPESVPHLGNTGGTNGNLDSLDDRLFAAHIRNGRLWTAHNFTVNTSGVASTAAGSRNAVRWYEIQNLNSTPSLVQSGTIFDSAATNPQHRWIPSIMVSGQGHAAVGYSNAGAASYANAATVGRLADDTLGTMQTPVTYTASTFAYNPPGDAGGAGSRRWGDYSYTSLDPCDDMTMWTIQEFTNATNSYGVRAVKLIAPPPATPSAANPATVPSGSSSVTVTITGTVVSGSGFYDTPANLTDACRQRLTAAVTGGVTVNSVTYVSPTLVQLNLSTVGATAGPQNVTLTNPDGQSLTGNGLIQVAASATITLSNLSQTYDGAPKPVTVTTEPPALSVAITYTGVSGTTWGPTTTAPTNAGTYSVTVVVTDALYYGSAADTLFVLPATTALALTSAPNPSAVGQSVTFTATTTVNAPGAGTPTGVLTLTIDSNPITQTLSAAGIVTYVTSALAIGVHPVTADYSGDANFTGSSQTLSGGQVVTDIAITGLNAVNDSPTRIGSTTHFTAAITTGSNVLYAWNFGDGHTASGAQTSHQYAQIGAYTAIVTATNSLGSIRVTTVVTIAGFNLYLPLVVNQQAAAAHSPVVNLVAVNRAGPMLSSQGPWISEADRGQKLFRWALYDRRNE